MAQLCAIATYPLTMSLDELKEHIKEEVVLREGDLFEWQWRQMGLIAAADEAGVPPGEFLALVNEVSRAVNPYFGRISDLKIKVSDLARINLKKLTDPQINKIIAEATRLQLLPDFVRDRWIPAILATVPEPAEPPAGEPIAVVAGPSVASEPAAQPVTPDLIPPTVSPVQATTPPPIPTPAAGADRDAVTRKVYQFLDDYEADKHIPARVLKALFLATNFDERVLADAVLTYLSAYFYAAETPVQGEALKDKLLSTNWRHLSWWESTATPPEPVRSPGATPAPRRNGSSDTTVIGLSVVVVGLMIGGVWWTTRDKPVARPVTVEPTERAVTEPVAKPKSKRKRRSKSSTTTSGTSRQQVMTDSVK